MSDLVPVPEYRPGRNYIRVGDTVRCHPRVGRRFDAKVRKILTRDGEVVEVEVFGGGMIRTFVPERIIRKAQSRNRTVTYSEEE
jgi:hypothetical protein